MWILYALIALISVALGGYGFAYVMVLCMWLELNEVL